MIRMRSSSPARSMETVNRRRNFATGWVSGKDPLVMALIWQVLDTPAEAEEFEAEVVRDLDIVEVLRATNMEDLKKQLASKYDA